MSVVDCISATKSNACEVCMIVHAIPNDGTNVPSVGP